MLWTLTKFEIKKAVWSKFFLIALILLLLVNMALCLPPLEYLSTFGGGRSVADSFRKDYSRLNAMTPEEKAAFEQAMTEKYGDDVFSPFFPQPQEMYQVPGYLGDEFSDSAIVECITHLREQNEKAMTLKQRVLNGAEFFEQEAISEGNAYEMRRNLQISRLYSAPRMEQTVRVWGWADFLFTDAPSLLSTLLILLMCAGMFTKEAEQGTALLLHTSKNGKGKTLAAKFLAAAICAAVLTALFYTSALLMVWLDVGLLGADQPVSAIQNIELFPFSFTVAQFAMLSVLCKMFAAVVMSSLLCTVSALSKNSVIAYSAGALALGVSVLLTLFPPDSEWLAGPLTLIRTRWYFDTYYTANIFGFPVLWAVVQGVLWSVLASGLIFTSHKVYHRKRSRL